MIVKLFASRDTFITDYRSYNVPQTASNMGASEILHVFKKVGYSGSSGVTSSSYGHALIKFDLSTMQDLISENKAPGTGVTYVLRMFDAKHSKTLPYSFDVEVQPVAQDWDEGRGEDVDKFSDKGFANWDKAKSNVFWTVPGSSGSGPIFPFHFDTGHEDVELDITTIVEQWLSGTLTNNGLRIAVSSSLEADSSDYYIKMFHARNTSFLDKRPCIEARWDSSLRDDRGNLHFGVSGSIMIYNVVDGQLTNITSVGTGSIGMRLKDGAVSGSIAIITGSFTGMTGVYSASFAIASQSFSGALHDIWFDLDDLSSIVTGTLSFDDLTPVSSIRTKKYDVSVSNLQDEYSVNELVRLNMFIKPHDYNPARVLTASLDASGTVIKKAFYRIDNDRTQETILPFFTGSAQYTRLSYDENGNYLDLHMGVFSPGNVYRIKFLLDVDGQKQYIDDGFKFRVVK